MTQILREVRGAQIHLMVVRYTGQRLAAEDQLWLTPVRGLV